MYKDIQLVNAYKKKKKRSSPLLTINKPEISMSYSKSTIATLLLLLGDLFSEILLRI